MRWLIIVLLSLTSAQAVDIASKRAILVDINTQSTLLQKRVSETFESGTLKNLSLFSAAIEALKQNEIDGNSPIIVSEEAWKAGSAGALPSLLLKPREKISFENLLKGAILTEGNDALFAMQEILVKNKSSEALTKQRSYLCNNDKTSLKDYSECALKLVRKYPEYHSFFKQEKVKSHEAWLFNQNALAKQGLGLALAKTADGYSLVGTYQNLLVAISGASSHESAEKDAFALLNWGRDGFELVKLFNANTSVGEISLAGYEKPSVKGRVLEEVDVLISQGEKPYLISQIMVKQPFSKKKSWLNWFETLEPIKKGDTLGMLQLISNSQLLKELPIIADETIAPLPFYKRWLQ